jgi:hypothetical protein
MHSPSFCWGHLGTVGSTLGRGFWPLCYPWDPAGLPTKYTSIHRCSQLMTQHPLSWHGYSGCSPQLSHLSYFLSLPLGCIVHPMRSGCLCLWSLTWAIPPRPRADSQPPNTATFCSPYWGPYRNNSSCLYHLEPWRVWEGSTQRYRWAVGHMFFLSSDLQT